MRPRRVPASNSPILHQKHAKSVLSSHFPLRRVELSGKVARMTTELFTIRRMLELGESLADNGSECIATGEKQKGFSAVELAAHWMMTANLCERLDRIIAQNDELLKRDKET